MGSNIIELAKLGHERAAELKASCGAVDVRSLAQMISDLATQLEVQFVRSTNIAVQLANAESKCREMAAENAGLKNFIINDCHVAHIEPETFYEEEIIRYVSADGYEPETPATDAFLAEVREQARNELIDELESRFNEMTETLPPELRSGAAGAAAFVSTFRKGAAL
ncbi:TPA: hypothetical protein N8T39_000713 [Escherichia coli]|nr:hypothetical protein [Escherichia coli]